MSDKLVHEALFYRGTAEFVSGTLPFLEAGLRAGEPILVAVPGPHIDALAEALGPAAVSLRLLDMCVAGRNPGRIIPWVLYPFAYEHGGRPVRIVGEPIWAGRSALEYPACAQHEAMINLAFGELAATVLCPYDVAALDPHVVADARRTHPVLVADGARGTSPGYAPDDVVSDHNSPLPDPPAHAPTTVFRDGELAAVRDFVGRHATRAGLGGDRVREVQLAIDELATNAVTHGGGEGVLTMWVHEGLLACQVRDRGHCREWLVGRVPPPPDSFGGRGLVLVNYLADLVRTHLDAAGTTVLALFGR